jgi:hypothetical protein
MHQNELKDRKSIGNYSLPDRQLMMIERIGTTPVNISMRSTKPANKTRFHGMLNKPSNDLDKFINELVNSYIKKEHHEKIIPIRDRFNDMSDTEYKWYFRTFQQISSMNDLMNLLEEVLRRHSINQINSARLPEHITSCINSFLGNLLVEILPWKSDVESCNAQIKKYMLQSFQPQSIYFLNLHKDLIIDEVAKKETIVKLAFGQLGAIDQEYRSKEVILNKNSFRFELVDRQAYQLVDKRKNLLMQ